MKPQTIQKEIKLTEQKVERYNEAISTMVIAMQSMNDCLKEISYQLSNLDNWLSKTVSEGQRLVDTIKGNVDHDCKLDAYGTGHCEHPIHGEKEHEN